MKKILGFILVCVINIPCIAQLKPVYIFQEDDSVLKKNYYDQALQQQTTLIGSLGKEYKHDYKEVYGDRFNEVAKLLQSSRAVTAPEPQQYLQTILKKITDANEELQLLQIRLIFTRDWWPNAYSVGEGTLFVNAGLMIFLDNEAELVFVICHELAHYYLDHSNKAIKKNVEYINSEGFKNEVKRLSKQQFRVGQQLEELEKKFAFDNRHHSRDNEAEADRYAFTFMKNTDFDTHAIITCLQMLDKVDDSLLYKPLNLEQVFNFPDYPFKKKWIEKESAIFGDLKEDDSPLTLKEKDSLKTHPDCSKRMALLSDSIRMGRPGSKFLVAESTFRRLKKDFFVEMTEENYKSKDLGRNLYYSLLMLQQEENRPVAIYSVARALNLAYETRKNHSLGTMFVSESRSFPADYNLLLRMLGRLQLNEIAALSYNFCKQYVAQMSGYAGFGEEMNKAGKLVQ